MDALRQRKAWRLSSPLATQKLRRRSGLRLRLRLLQESRCAKIHTKRTFWHSRSSWARSANPLCRPRVVLLVNKTALCKSTKHRQHRCVLQNVANKGIRRNTPISVTSTTCKTSSHTRVGASCFSQRMWYENDVETTCLG